MLITDKPGYYGLRYYIRGIKGCIYKITIKGIQTSTGPSYLAEPAESDDDANLRDKPQTGRFDSDFFLVGVDNHASKCMSKNRKHFVSFDPMKNQTVKGVGGVIRVLGRGTLRWRVEDCDGRIHVLGIKGALYVPNLPMCLVCPHHWSQQANDNFPTGHGTWCEKYSDECVLRWY